MPTEFWWGYCFFGRGSVVFYNCSSEDLVVNYAAFNFGLLQSVLLHGVLVLAQCRKLRHIATPKIK